MEWREVRSPETGELLFRFWPERMLIEVVGQRAGRHRGSRAPEIVHLQDYMHRDAGVNFAHIDGIDIEHEPV